MSKLAEYLSLGLLGFSIAVPLLIPIHTLPIASFYEEWTTIALGLGGCIALLTAHFWNDLTIPRSALHLSWLVCWIALQAALVQHIYPAQALIPILYLCWAALLIIVVSWLRRQLAIGTVLYVLSWFLLVSGVIQSLAGLIQYLWLDNWFADWVSPRLHERIYGNIAQSNHFAVHVMLATVTLMYLHAQRHIANAIAYSLLAIFAIVLTLAGSRSVWLYALGALVLSLATYQKNRDVVHRRLLATSSVLLALLLATLFIAPLVSDWLNMTLIGQPETPAAMDKGSSGLSGRFTEWRKAWLIFLQAPIIGVGMGHYAWHSFSMSALPDFAGTPGAQIFAHTHNLFLQVAVELGIIGVILLVWLIAGWLRQFARSPLSMDRWLISGVLLILFIHSNLEYPLWYSNFLGIAAIFLGLGDDRAVRVNFTPRLGQAAAAGSLILSFAILLVTYNGFRQLTNVNALILEKGPQEAAARLWAVSRNPLLTPWAEAVLATHSRPDKDQLGRQLVLIARTMHHHPNRIKVHRYILYLVLAGRTDEAILWMRHGTAAYAESFARFACLLQQYADERFQPLLTEADSLFATTWFRRVVPDPGAVCASAPSLIPAEWVNYRLILGR